jgi:uncharacterized protein with NRDE domain
MEHGVDSRACGKFQAISNLVDAVEDAKMAIKSRGQLHGSAGGD